MKEDDKSEIDIAESMRLIREFILKETGLTASQLEEDEGYMIFAERIAAGTQAELELRFKKWNVKNRTRFNAIWSPSKGYLRTYFGKEVVGSKMTPITGPALRMKASERKFNFFSGTA